MAMGATKLPFLNKRTLLIGGILAVLFLAVALLWHGNATSSQAVPALVAQICFKGEYRVADGQWQPIEAGEHIPATKGDVVLRGNFHIFAPDGEYIGIFSGDTPIALYLDHISLTFYENGYEPYPMDRENPLYGDAACGEDWNAYTLMSESEEPLEIRIHNPHSFGNETAIDEMLANIAFWTGYDFEREILNSGNDQRNMGLLFAIVALMLLGTALFATLIHIKNTRIMWVLGLTVLFAGTYLSYSADGISFWSDSVVSNTVILGVSMMFYMLFLSMAIVYLLRGTKKIGTAAVFAAGVADAVFIALPLFTPTLFYDTWLYWVITQGVSNTALLGCLIVECCAAKGKTRWRYIGLLLPLVSFGVDVAMTGFGVWKGGVASAYVFIVFVFVALVTILKIMPQSINALAKAKELETERVVLNAQLSESRVATMMSQIRPHFIYNTLGSIEQLCVIDPPKAGELVHNFAKYLRGNFGELDNPKPILMSQEMEHVRYYISIEKVRFPDMTFNFTISSSDFHIPALTIQPIVENAIKHGLMKLPRGGNVQVTAYETATHYCVSVEDDGVGFDTGVLLDERKHVGIRNIRGRLKAMVNGELAIESTIGAGTKALITIPKEG